MRSSQNTICSVTIEWTIINEIIAIPIFNDSSEHNHQGADYNNNDDDNDNDEEEEDDHCLLCYD